MTAREFSVSGAGRRHPDRNDPDQYDGVQIYVVSEHLKARPLDAVRLTDRQALQLAADLLQAVVRGVARP